MAEATAAVKPVEVKVPEKSNAPQPIEKPKQPLGETEQTLVKRIQQDGEPDKTLQDIAGVQPITSEDQIQSPTDEGQNPKIPRFIKEFSKEHSAEERSQLAREIWARRKEFFQQKQAGTEQRAQLKEDTGNREVELDKQLQKLQELRERVAQLSGSWFSRVLNYTRLRGLTTDLQTVEETYQLLQKEQATQIAHEQAVANQLAEKKTMTELESGRQEIRDFYEGEKEKWANVSYTKEDIQKYFTEDHLASLSDNDYALLLRRFPSEMVTHVTRQGIRDHTGGDFHTAGLGEYSDGFMQILADKRLHSAFAIYLQEGLTDEAIARCLDLGGTIQTKKDALYYLNNMTNKMPGGQFSPATFADRTAVHLATEEVADSIYGSERGNEVFFAFPAAHIASEHLFQGKLGANESTGSYHNDQWIWSQDQKGLALDAGLVFIPTDAQVDPSTGSRYVLDEHKRPIERQDRIDALRSFVESDSFPNMYESMRSAIISRSSDALDEIRRRLSQEFYITDPKLQMTLLEIDNIVDLKASLNADQYSNPAVREEFSFDNASRRVLQKANMLYQESTNTVTSREFWENYFKQNPDQRPKRVVYYEDGNPTQALMQWRESRGITKKAESSNLGFSESEVTEDRPEITEGMEVFRSRAEEVIDKYFGSKSKKKTTSVSTP